MIYDHRTYVFKPGTIAAFQKLYESEGYQVQTKYLGQPVGWYIGHDIGPLNTFIHIWAYESLADREERRGKLGADPLWQAYVTKLAPMLESQHTQILRQPGFIRTR